MERTSTRLAVQSHLETTGQSFTCSLTVEKNDGSDPALAPDTLTLCGPVIRLRVLESSSVRQRRGWCAIPWKANALWGLLISTHLACVRAPNCRDAPRVGTGFLL